MSGIGDSLSELSRILHRGCYVIPGYIHHHDGAVGGHAGVEAGGEVAVVLVEDGAHGGVLAGDGYSQDGVVWFDGLGVGQVEGEAVQAVLGSHRSGERERVHNHFLKSTVVCGQCGSRLLVQNTKNGKGVLYPYFICARRQRLHDCSFKAVLIEVVEARMQEVYRQEIERYLLAELARIEGEKDRSVQSLTVRRTNLEDERRRLLQAHYGGAVPLELLKEEQDRLGRELVGIQRQLDAYQADAKLVRARMWSRRSICWRTATGCIWRHRITCGSS